MAARKLSISTSKGDLSGNTYLLLTFNPVDTTDLYKSQYPVMWKILKFAANSTATSVIDYSARLAAGVSEVLGQKSVFTVDGDGFASWSEPAPKPAPGTGQINALNESGQRQDMSIGMIGPGEAYQPVLLWRNVGDGFAMTAKFTPMGRTETQIIRGAIQTGLLGQWDLAKLRAMPNVNTFRLYEQVGSGKLAHPSRSPTNPPFGIFDLWPSDVSADGRSGKASVRPASDANPPTSWKMTRDDIFPLASPQPARLSYNQPVASDGLRSSNDLRASPSMFSTKSLSGALLVVAAVSDCALAQYGYPYRRRHSLASGVIAAIAIVCVVIPLLLCALAVCLVMRRRRRASQTSYGVSATTRPPGRLGRFTAPFLGRRGAQPTQGQTVPSIGYAQGPGAGSGAGGYTQPSDAAPVDQASWKEGAPPGYGNTVSSGPSQSS
ncbi:hypothetical protein HETIRDRAFT_450218 [Heterobasidion irregulare TC 32-1]|uniref:Uncharacterized protein n=1 Tax=Heterobasidion irregulare (strain TC 32-1) TaxID=747525 RepID=W4KGQ3_HETIT|nr:uncharacterized protein HETIRDRAFT_450218 [Heterobasidion irregulare TC 32-1]ETW84889.1 hypothetical protein HETIRDRAFT_450218 [Heterobasidion irregulare TC 32-1]